MKLSKTLSLILIAAMVLSLCACGASATEVSSVPDASAEAEDAVPATSGAEEVVCVTVTDMIGRELDVVPGSYERVVCIGAGALRMYSYICGADYLCGVEDIDNTSLGERPKMFDSVARPYVIAYGEAYTSLPSCGVGGPNAQTAEAEKILACDPDIVISEYEDVEKAEALELQLGVPVVTLRSGSKGVFDNAFTGSLTLLGQIFGREERASELIAFVSAEAEEISSRTADVPEAERPAVYVCGLGNWGTTNHLMTSENYASFEIANVRSAVSGTGTPGVFSLEEEKFVELGEAMDIIVMDAAAVKNIKPLFDEDPTLFDSCRAWNEGEVYLQMAYNAYYTNYELMLADTWFIGKSVYPERFSDIDMTAKLNEITEMFLGAELADEISACASSFGGYQRIDTGSFFG